MKPRVVEVGWLGQVVDDLGRLRARIAGLVDLEKELVGHLRKSGQWQIEGRLFRATVSAYDQMHLDKKAVVRKCGAAWVRKHSKPKHVVAVRTVSRTGMKNRNAA